MQTSRIGKPKIQHNGVNPFCTQEPERHLDVLGRKGMKTSQRQNSAHCRSKVWFVLHDQDSRARIHARLDFRRIDDNLTRGA